MLVGGPEVYVQAIASDREWFISDPDGVWIDI
jgi:hypothetical protein